MSKSIALQIQQVLDSGTKDVATLQTCLELAEENVAPPELTARVRTRLEDAKKAAADTLALESSALDDARAGFRQIADQAAVDIEPLVNEMTRLAKEARGLQDKTSQWDFAGRTKATYRVAELKGQYDALGAKIGEIRNDVRTHGQEGVIKDFLGAVDAHLTVMERHFKPEENPHLNRF